MSGIIVASLILSACVAPTTVSSPNSAATECVIVLHGLTRSARSMERIGSALEENNYQTANIDYESTGAPIEELAISVIEEGLELCRSFSPAEIHFVAHSLGGILLRYYLQENAIPELGRVVMLAPPNQGSEAAEFFRNFPGFKLIFGESGQQLGTGPESLPLQLGPATFDVGIIAGDRSIDPFSSMVLPNPDDGKVSVASTRLEGMNDFIVVPHSHAFIMKSDDVIRQILFFLEQGQFDHDSAEQ